MLISLGTWITSSIGKLVAKWTAFIAVAVAVYWKIYADGQAAERAKQVAEKLDSVRAREKIHDDVQKMPDAAVRDELSRWVRNDG
jgi:hypothetical protein